MTVDVSMFFFIACVTVLFIPKEVKANNSSDTVGRVVSTRSEEQLQRKNNFNSTLLVSTTVERRSVNDTEGDVMPTKKEEQTNVSTINLSETMGDVMPTTSSQHNLSTNNLNTTLLVNSSNIVSKVMPIISKIQDKANKNLNKRMLFSLSVDAENSSEKAKVTLKWCKGQIETNNLNTTNQACVNHEISLQNTGNKKKSVQNKTKVMDGTQVQDFFLKHFINAPSSPPCPQPNEIRTPKGVCTVSY